MSEKNIYLATNKYENNGVFTKIRKIFVYRSTIRPFADGYVQGLTNNQFSLDESNRYLRIATSNSYGDVSKWTNNVFVLDYYLRPYGKLTGVAPA